MTCVFALVVRKKVCNPDIHKENLAAAKLRIYSQLEYDLKTHNEIYTDVSLCVQGCS